MAINIEFDHYEFNRPHHPGEVVRMELSGGKVIKDVGKIDDFKKAYDQGVDQNIRIKRVRNILNLHASTENLSVINDPDEEVIASITYKVTEIVDDQEKEQHVVWDFSPKATAKVFLVPEEEVDSLCRYELPHPRGRGRFIIDAYFSESTNVNESLVLALEEIRKGTFSRMYLL